jgi:very-short-patch-repair endonuclease
VARKSELQDRYKRGLVRAGLFDGCEPEFTFLNYAIDFAWYVPGLAVEIEGGIWAGKPCPVCRRRPGGRHNSGAGFERDIAKYNALAEDGWALLRFTGKHIASGEAIERTERTLSNLRERGAA